MPEDQGVLHTVPIPEAMRPSDFPDEDYERDWPDRFRAEDLNDIGRCGLGLS